MGIWESRRKGKLSSAFGWDTASNWLPTRRQAPVVNFHWEMAVCTQSPRLNLGGEAADHSYLILSFFFCKDVFLLSVKDNIAQPRDEGTSWIGPAPPPNTKRTISADKEVPICTPASTLEQQAVPALLRPR